MALLKKPVFNLLVSKSMTELLDNFQNAADYNLSFTPFQSLGRNSCYIQNYSGRTLAYV